MRVRERLGVSRRRQRQASRAMQLALVGFLFVGLERGSVGIVVNAGVAFAVTHLPGLLERDYDIALDPALGLWITTAVFLHAFGTVGVPGVSVANLYQSVWWWDHLTHALSASLVAAVGYTVVRAVDVHSDGVVLPRRFTFAFILLFVVAFGVLWEVLEFAVGGLGGLLGTEAVLTQYGLEDTMLDLVFDAAGGVVVAAWGTAYLADVVGTLQERLADSRWA